MRDKIRAELSDVYDEYYTEEYSPFEFGAQVGAAKKRLKADVMVDLIYDVAKNEHIDLTYHSALHLCKLFLSRGILSKKILDNFANVENDGENLIKRETKRTATEKVKIDYGKIKEKYKGMFCDKLSSFDETFKSVNNNIKKSRAARIHNK